MDIVFGMIGFIKMYGTHIQSTEKYYATQAMIKKAELEKIARSSSRFIKSQYLRYKYLNEIKEDSERFVSELRKYPDPEIKRKILSVMDSEIQDLRYQEHVLQYGNYEQYAAIEIRKNSDGLGIFDYILKGVGIVVGALQVATGIGIMLAGDASILGAPLGTVAGAFLIVHGISAIDENLGAIITGHSSYSGFARVGYENTFESLGFNKTTGSLVYAGVDLALSGYGLFRAVLKEDAWKLFRYINTDYVRGYQQMSGYALGFEVMADGITIKSTYDIYNDPNYNKK
ncbi:DUF4225 domain-containing protein [Xenorhabdus cabanillasii]|uniref:DUF4225 domain-containing protein n=1 Tax=Xenorhabdus cabanillasii TaxID=351673 RepID=UPI002B40F8B3|nr:DUF4225 domain-containing protein [Xenorhabdus sp. Flor]